MKTMIETNNLSISFGEIRVLNNVNLKVEKGEIFGLLGPSGAGKTTLIKILTGQLVQQEGESRVFEVDSKSLKSNTYTRIGMVLDNIGLYERLTCYDNLKLFTDIYGIPKTNINRVLEMVDLSNVIKTPVNKLSKGMKQRLALARAIIHEPDILFLDEPTSGLDPSTAVYIHNIILNEKQKGTTIFLTTHNMEEATKLCDNVALMNHGEIIEYGNPKDICSKYNHKNSIEIDLKDGSKITLKNDSSSADSIFQLFKDDNVRSIQTTEPNLETVFIELTGRGLL